MMKQQFVFNDGSMRELYVIGQKSKSYDTMSIQISKVLDIEAAHVEKDAAIVPYKYIYEEIDKSDFVTYAEYTSEHNIKKNYPWAI